MFQPTGTGGRGNLLPQRIFCFPSVGCRHVRPVRQLGVNLPKTAGQKHKKYPRFQVEIGGISFHLFLQVAGGFAFLPYAATPCGTQRMEIRRYKITFRLLPLKILSLHRYEPALRLVTYRDRNGHVRAKTVYSNDTHRNWNCSVSQWLYLLLPNRELDTLIQPLGVCRAKLVQCGFGIINCNRKAMLCPS